jgi:hypothetical protein
MSGRIGLGAAVLALIGWAAAAAPIPGTDQQLGSWIVQADDDGSGKFAYCDATRDGGGPLVHIGQSASGSWQIGFTNAGWQFAVGQDVTVTLFIDRASLSARAPHLGPTTFSNTMPDTTLVDACAGDMLPSARRGGTTFSSTVAQPRSTRPPRANTGATSRAPRRHPQRRRAPPASPRRGASAGAASPPHGSARTGRMPPGRAGSLQPAEFAG